MQNKAESVNTLEMEMIKFMDKMDEEETTALLEDIKLESFHLSQSDIEDINERTVRKLNMSPAQLTPSNSIVSFLGEAKRQRGFTGWKRNVVLAVALVLCVIALKYNSNIARAFQQMVSLIPGVGIVENNEDILYQLKVPVTVENEQATLNITTAVATKNEITLYFDLTRKNYTTEQLIEDTKAEWELIKKGGRMKEPNIYVEVENKRFQIARGSGGGGYTENYIYTFQLDPEYIDTSKNYKLVYEDYNISVDFQLLTLAQYSSLNEIGSTDIHNNISLTATSTLENNQLKVNVYPVNYSKYKLISFVYEYDFDYFGQKLILKTEKGDKGYTLPGSYGTGMNAAFTFDVEDGAKDYMLSIPYVVVETSEEEKITLPIPEERERIDVNKEVTFENGSVIITSVEKGIADDWNEYGDLKVNLEYKNVNEKQQLVSALLTRKASEGWSMEYDAQNRVKTIHYMLNKKDKNKIKLYVTKPRYVLLEEYLLKLSDKSVRQK